MPPLGTVVTRVELWNEREQLGGVRLHDLAARDVLELGKPDAIGRVERRTVSVVATHPAAQTARRRHVVRYVEYTAAGVLTVREQRVQTIRRAMGPASGDVVGRVTLSTVPLLLDWGVGGRVRDVASSGRTTFDGGGVLTPAELLTTYCLPGLPGWTLGTIARTDPRALSWSGKTRLEILRLIEDTWAVEASEERLSDGTIRLHLLVQTGAQPSDPLVLLLGTGAGGGLLSVQAEEDATDLATVVVPTGANGTLMSDAAWPCTAVNSGTGWVNVVDDAGGPGPVQLDSQFVGAYVQDEDGVRHAILASLAGDGVTSQLQLASVGAIAVGDWLQLRADSAGTRLVEVTDPVGIQPPPAGYGRVEVTVPRDNLVGAWNMLRNPRGRVYTSPTAPPTGWALWSFTPFPGSLTAPSIARNVTPPVGCPLGDDTPTWTVTLPPDGYGKYRTPWTPAIDATPGDATGGGYFIVYVNRALTKVWTGDATSSSPDVNGGAPVDTTYSGYGQSVQVAIERLDPVTGAVTTLAAERSWIGQSWLTLGISGQALTGTARYRLVLSTVKGQALLAGMTYQGAPLYLEEATSIAIDVALAQVTRSAAQLDAVEGNTVCAIHQVGNAYLRDFRDGTTSVEAVVIDRAAVDPDRYGDQPLTLGRDVRVQVPAIGLDAPARLVARAPNGLEPGAPERLALTSPPRQTFTEALWAWIRRRGLGASSTSSAGNASGGAAASGTGGSGSTGGTGGTGSTGGTSGSTSGGVALVPVPIVFHASAADGGRAIVQHEDGSAFAIAVGADAVEWNPGARKILDLRNVDQLAAQGYVDARALGPAGMALIYCALDTATGVWLGLNGRGLHAPLVAPTFGLDVPGVHEDAPATVDARFRRQGVVVSPFVCGGDGTLRPYVGDLALTPVASGDPTGGTSTWGGPGGIDTDDPDACAVCALPTVAGTLEFRLSAQRLCALATGAAVTTWPDASPNARDGVREGAGVTYTRDALGPARGAVTTLGDSTPGDIAIPIPSGVTARTIYCVVASTGGAGGTGGTSGNWYDHAGLLDADIAGAHDDFGVGMTSAGKLIAGLRENMTPESSTAINDGLPHVVTIRMTVNTGLSLGTIDLRIDGALEATVTGTVLGALQPTTLGLGGRAAAHYLAARYGDVVSYDAAHDNTDLSKIEITLMDFYGVPY